jgi:hypothetical protein
MGDRWVVLTKNDEGKFVANHGCLMEGGAGPELNKEPAERGEVKAVKSDTLRANMVEGEEKEAIDGFGFPQSVEPTSPTGVTRTADAVKHEQDDFVLPTTSHDKVRAGESSGGSSRGAAKDSAAAAGGTEEAKATKGSRRQSKRAGGARKGARKASAKARKKAA